MTCSTACTLCFFFRPFPADSLSPPLCTVVSYLVTNLLILWLHLLKCKSYSSSGVFLAKQLQMHYHNPLDRSNAGITWDWNQIRNPAKGDAAWFYLHKRHLEWEQKVQEQKETDSRNSEVRWESYSLSITGRGTETSHSSQTLVTFSHYWVIIVIGRSQHVLIQRERSTAVSEERHMHTCSL